MTEEERMGAVEALLFVRGEALDREELSRAADCSGQELEALLRKMSENYRAQDRGICMVELGGKFQLCTKPVYYERLVQMEVRPSRPALTDAMLETLAIVAYRQPVVKAEINRIRGVVSDRAVNRLIEYGLVREAGRLEAPGRPILLATTDEFLRRFGPDALEPAHEENDTDGEREDQEE